MIAGMKIGLRLHRAHIALIHDIVMAGIAFVSAVALRLGADAVEEAPRVVLLGTPIFMTIAALVFTSTGLYRGIWRYASLDDILAIARAATVTVLLTLTLLFLSTRGDSLPRSSLIIAWAALILLLAAPRVIYRVLKDGHVSHLLRRTDLSKRVPVLLIGAGDEADLFIRAMARNPSAPYRAVGILDEKTARVGLSIRGVPVLGSIASMETIVARLRANGQGPQRMLLTRDMLPAQRLRELLELADGMALPLARLPKLTDFQTEGDGPIEIRPIALEDLLGRPQTPLDRDAMASLVKGRRVLVTGAGGSIGSELALQIAGLEPAELILIDSSEFALYQIDMLISERLPDLPRAALLADVRDKVRLTTIFKEKTPELVFHAAALKHVPMLESNTEEGVLTNVLGTRNVAECARAVDAVAMVMISSDKAVNPGHVMGATKRLAESWCQSLDLAEQKRREATGKGVRFVTVRFGNVLGSTGSVVPLFQRQLARGGPLTVTHPDMTRYFMTIREAVELVLQASALGVSDPSASGKIYVLDMGQPVKIMDLAQQMIRLAGLRPEIDVKIAITGLRPGERLHEELFHDTESVLAETSLEGVLLAAPRVTDGVVLARALDELEAAASQRRVGDTLRLLDQLVPEFTAPTWAQPKTVREA
jgi:FlaA1/EpsC-like NDP-sugar epimerase